MEIQVGRTQMRVDAGECTHHIWILSGSGSRCLLARDEACLGELVQLVTQRRVVRRATQEVAQRLDEGGGLGRHPATVGAKGCNPVPVREAATLLCVLGAAALGVVSPPLEHAVACVVGEEGVALPHLAEEG